MIHENSYEKSMVSAEMERLLRNIKLPGTPGKRKKAGDTCSRNIDWVCDIRSATSETHDKTMDILVETHGDDVRLQDFVMQLDDIVSEIAEQYGGIIGHNELWKGIHTISVLIEPDKVSELMMQIAFIPEVEKVEDGMHFGEKPESAEGRIGVSPYPMNTRSGKKIKVTLKEDILLGY